MLRLPQKSQEKLDTTYELCITIPHTCAPPLLELWQCLYCSRMSGFYAIIIPRLRGMYVMAWNTLDKSKIRAMGNASVNYHYACSYERRISTEGKPNKHWVYVHANTSGAPLEAMLLWVNARLVECRRPYRKPYAPENRMQMRPYETKSNSDPTASSSSASASWASCTCASSSSASVSSSRSTLSDLPNSSPWPNS